MFCFVWNVLRVFFFLNIFIDYAITVVPLPPLHSTPSCPPPPPTFPPYSSCPWVIHINSLASTFPILFLPYPYLFSTYHLCYLLPLPFPPLSPSLLITLHVISISVILYLFQLFPQFVFVFVILGSVVDSCEFLVIYCSQF